MELSIIHSGSYRGGLKPGEVPQLMYNKLAIILTDTIKGFFSFEISGIMPSCSSFDFGH